MSAHVVDKDQIDLLVCAADHYGRKRGDSGFRWHRTDDEGEFTGWYELDRYAESNPSVYAHVEKVMPSQLGQVLVSENVRSVSARYPDDDVDRGELPGPIDAYYLGPYIYEDPGVVPTPGEVFNLIDCLDYQSCETDDWDQTEAFCILRFLRETVCRHVDGYEVSSGWIDLDQIAARRKETEVG